MRVFAIGAGTARQRGGWRAPWLALALLLAPPGHGADAATGVQDLRYGVALYEYFQQNYFQALTELRLGELRRDMPHHAEFARLLGGGISLAYGLDAEAESIFSQLLEQHPRPAVRDRAWFFLGKQYYRRGESDRALAALSRSGDQLPAALAQERDYLRASLALRRGDFAAAALPDTGAPNPWLPYLLFNRGAAEAGIHSDAAAAASFSALAALPAEGEEQLALRDRAATAAGFAYIAAGQPRSAISALQKVRLDSADADRALFGYGWAASQLGDYREALKPWQALVQQSPLRPAVQEGLLAVPHAYEQLGAGAQALQEYERAERLFDAELARIDAAIATLRSASPLNLWLEAQAQQGWVSRGGELPLQPRLPYLEQLLARNDIQETIKDLRDLAALEHYLGEWLDRLAALHETQQLQQRRRQQALSDRPDARLEQTYRALREQRDMAAAQLREAQRSGDGAPLMTAEELALARRLERVRGAIDALRAQGRDVGAAEAQYRLYRGLLLWQVQDAYAPRRWDMVRQLRELDAELARSERLQQRLAGLTERARRPERSADIRALVARLEQLLLGIRGAQAQGEAALRLSAVAELQAQQQRLRGYLGRTRLAMARLYDQGATEQQP